MKKSLKSAISLLLSLLLLIGVFPFSVFASNNYTLPYNEDAIRQVGYSTVSGPCAAYALAYARTVLDGYAHSYSEYYRNGSCNWSLGDYYTAAATSEQGVLQAVYEQLNLGRPCIVHVTSAKKTSHWLAVIGYQNVTDHNNLSMDNFLVLDSGTYRFATPLPMSYTYRAYSLHADLRYCYTYTDVEGLMRATLSIDHEDNRIGENFTFTMSADKPVSYYWFTIRDAKTGEEIISQAAYGTFTTSFQRCGHYYAWCTAANPTGTADSNVVDFYVYGNAPTQFSMWVSPSEITLGESVDYGFRHNTYFARIYMSMFDPSGALCEEGWYDQDEVYTYEPTQTGTYTAHATMHTVDGNYNTEWVSYVVKDTVHEHSWELSSQEPATCLAYGTRTYTCSDSACEATYSEVIPALGHADGAKVHFGSYPQSLVTESNITEQLNSLVQDNDWCSFGFYYGENGYTLPQENYKPIGPASTDYNDFAKYVDVELSNGTRYRGIRFSAYRPYNPYCETVASVSHQDENGVLLDTTYWFKYEPIVWRVLDAENGYLIAENALDARAMFDYLYLEDGQVKGPSGEDYDSSTLNHWLNSTFYTDAFSADERSFLKGSEYDASHNKVSLISYNNFTAYLPEGDRTAKPTSYAAYLGCYKDPGKPYGGNTKYFTSTFVDNNAQDSLYAYLIDTNGAVLNNDGGTFLNSRGVRPVIQLDLAKYQQQDAAKADCVNPGVPPAVTCAYCGMVLHGAVSTPAKGHTDVCTVGDTISYGSYPQSRVTDTSLQTVLNIKLSTELNSHSLEWQSYGYYHGNGTYASANNDGYDYMLYADVAYDGETYRAVKFTDYRPYSTHQCFYDYGDNDFTVDKDSWTDNAQYNNRYYCGRVYWFRFEPIQWKVLSVSENGEALVLCDQIIDSQPFNNKVYEDGDGNLYTDEGHELSANVYANSSIRTWYRDTFARYVLPESSENWADDIRDMTLAEATTEDYGFSANQNETDAARIAYPTDYAICQGVYVKRTGPYAGAANWGLQDHDANNVVWGVYSVSFEGGFSADADMCSNRKGVRPVATIDFSSYAGQTTTPPTCTETGVESAKCVRCGTEFNRELPINPSNHADPLTEIAYKAPTCLETGNNKYYQCSRCGKYFTATDCATETTPEEQTIDPLGHDFSASAERVHSLNNGTHNWKCSRCDAYGKADGDTQVVDGYVSCTYGNWSNNDAATHKRTCSVCSYVDTENHTWDDGAVDPAPTCTAKGVKTYTCTVEGCGATYTEEIEPNGHSFNGAYHNVSDGKHNRKCEFCDAYGLNGVENATEDCSGGTANCVDKAVCEHCQTAYGSVDANNHKSPEDRAAVAATCTAGGFTAGVYCTACDKWVSGHEPTDPLGHVFSGACANVGEGKHNYKCTRCDAYGLNGVENATENCSGGTANCVDKAVCAKCSIAYGSIDERNHKTELRHFDRVESTCLAEGNVEYWHCASCNRNFSDSNGTAVLTDVVIPKKDHSYTGAIKNDGNGENGTHSFLCVNGCSQYGGATAHVWDDGVIDPVPSCTETGIRTFTCTITGCGATYTEEIRPNGHSFSGEYHNVSDGKHNRKCEFCNVYGLNGVENATEDCSGGTANCVDKAVCEYCQTAYGSVDANNHKATENRAAVAATCTAGGFTAGVYCTACDKWISGHEPTDPLGHDFTGACANVGEGKHNYKCTRCDAYGLNGVENAAEDCSGGTANCVDKAVCEYCQTAYGSVDANNHKATENRAAVAATCTAGGFTAGVYCTACDKWVSGHEPTDPLGHDFTGACANVGEGKHNFKCTRCDAYGLNGVENATEDCSGGTATCVDKAVCEHCNTPYGDKLPHSYTGAIKNDGDGKTGTHSFLCVNGCNQYGGAVTHTWNSGTVTKQPTCTEDGTKTFTCTVTDCGGTYTEPIPRSHTEGNWTVKTKATCTEPGVRALLCAECSAEMQTEAIPARGHALGDWVVTKDPIVDGSVIELGTKERRCTHTAATEEYEACTYTETGYVPLQVPENKNNKDVKTEKNAAYDPNTGEVEITLNASTKGQAITTQTYTPLDIVLVLDQSGSMGYYMDKNERPNAANRHKNRKTALQNAANAFIEKIYQDSLLGLDHRISVVGFAMGNLPNNATDENGKTKYMEAYANTNILSLPTPKQYDPKPSAIAEMNAAYQASLISVNSNGQINPLLTKAITESLSACGSTAADLGLMMACKVFEQNDSTGRKRVVIFMTDGEPTYTGGFDTHVAEDAKKNARLLKDTYGAEVYSVGVLGTLNTNDNNNNYQKCVKFLKEVCSNPADHYISVSDAQGFIQSFSSIADESTTYTTDFDHVTLIDNLSPAFTLTQTQEDALRRDAVDQLKVAADQVTVRRLEDGTTFIRIADIHPTEKNGSFEVSFSFRASANEQALEAGQYRTNTKYAGVMVGSDPRFEQVFARPKVNVEQAEGVIRFMLNNTLYALTRVHSGVDPSKPDTSFDCTGWETIPAPPYEGNSVSLYATCEKYSVTWHIGDDTQTAEYYPGQLIQTPAVQKFVDGQIFTGWDTEVPTVMPKENKTFTAQFTPHPEHRYGTEGTVRTPATCSRTGERVFTCTDCGYEKVEPIDKLSHNWMASAIGARKDATDYSCVLCENCGASMDANLSFTINSISDKETRMNLSLRGQDNETVNLDGETITLMLGISDAMKWGKNENEIHLYREEADGSLTKLKATLSKSTGTVTFTTDHFSTYLLRTVTICSETDEHPDADGDGFCDDCGQSIADIEAARGTKCVCGKYHPGAFGGLIRFFHTIVYFFKNLFAKK